MRTGGQKRPDRENKRLIDEIYLTGAALPTVAAVSAACRRPFDRADAAALADDRRPGHENNSTHSSELFFLQKKVSPLQSRDTCQQTD